MCDTSRFVDNHIITVDVDPDTERNIRADERNSALDDVLYALRDWPGLDMMREFIERLRPGTPPGA